MGSDTKKCFTKMDEGRNMKDRVGIQVNQLYPVPIQKTSKEATGRQRESPVEEGLKDNHLISIGGREELTIYGVPSDEGLLWQDQIFDHPLKLLLYHIRFNPHFLR